MLRIGTHKVILQRRYFDRSKQKHKLHTIRNEYYMSFPTWCELCCKYIHIRSRSAKLSQTTLCFLVGIYYAQKQIIYLAVTKCSYLLNYFIAAYRLFHWFANHLTQNAFIAVVVVFSRYTFSSIVYSHIYLYCTFLLLYKIYTVDIYFLY